MKLIAAFLLVTVVAGCATKPVADPNPTQGPAQTDSAAAAVQSPAGSQASTPAVTPAPGVSTPPGSPARPAPAGLLSARDEYDAAMAKLSRGDRLGAIEGLSRATQLDPNFAEAWNDLSYLRLWQGPGSVAPTPPGFAGKEEPSYLSAARRALELKPGWAAAEFNLGFALLVDAHYAEAMEPLTRSANQQPDRPEPWVALGLALLGTGKANEAIAACQKAGPDYKWAQVCLVAAGKDFKELSETEAAVGNHRYTPGSGFDIPQGESLRISPPLTCGTRGADGWQVYSVDCWDREWPYSWSATKAETGMTKAGIGVGSPWAKVLQAYGASFQDDHGIYYTVSGLHMLITGNEKYGVTGIMYHVVSPFWTIYSWLHEPLRP